MSLEWIENVPESWTISESQFVLNFQKRDVLETDEIVTAFRDGQVTLRSNRRTDGFTMAEKEIGYQHICEGDLVIHSMDGGFGAIGVSDSCGKASPVVHAYTSSRCDLRFVAYQLRAAVNAGWVAAQAKGIRVRSTQFDRPALASFKIAYPPLETQQRIADYLDRETAEIDAAVADLDRYVELLEKRRRVVISTGFGNPLFSPVKQRLKFLTVSEDHKRIPIKSEDRAKLTGEFPYYGASGIIDHVNGFLWDNATRLLVSEDGANLVARNHPIAFIASGRYWVNNHAHVLRCLDGVPPELVAMAIENTSIAHLITGSAQPKLTASAMWDIEFDFPATVKDRLALLEYLSSELHEIDSLVAESKKLRELLLKRRSVLITEVVTGRKQV
ncbi:restriction endonuclease subunit S [Corynebacterium glutamicum]|uniref:restriction endonuclease subunit S n=1 Tax=Corynebacterium glutamicum TaxID=1718 RepID=UPI001467CB4E|nr:restriction endonuclease subunit S [Corynebacterium glutamicum]GFK17948.1 hypothetical protein KbCgl_05200 [Corynebacterium glutamicum]